MTVEVDSIEPGKYSVVVTPPSATRDWSTVEPVPASELESRLQDLGVHPRDIWEHIRAADRNREFGTTQLVRSFREFRRRAIAETISEPEISDVARELKDAGSNIDKPFLVNILGLAATPVAIKVLEDTLLFTQDKFVAFAILEVLHEREADAFSRVAKPFIRGMQWDRDGYVRGWAMAYAASLLERRRDEALFEEIVSVANNGKLDPIARKDARVALARLAKLDVGVALSGNGDALDRLIQLARQRIVE